MKYKSVIFTILMLGLSAHSTQAALVNTSPSLTTTDEALAKIKTHTPAEQSGFVISYREEVLLEQDPKNIEKQTQFAGVVNNRDIVDQYLKDQEQGFSDKQQKETDLSNYRYKKAVTTSTLNEHLIKAAGEIQVKPSDIHNPNYRSPLTTQKYQDRFEEISLAQASHQTRWQRTQRLKKSADQLVDLRRNNVKVKNDLKLKPHMKLRQYKADRILSAKNTSRISGLDEESWVAAVSPRLRKRMPNVNQRNLMLKHVYRQSKQHNIKPDLVLAVIQIESNFKQKAVSVVGAQGLMQIMPFWKKEIGSPSDNLHDIPTNIRYGTYILKHYLNREKGKVIPALARYNGSYGRVKYPNKVIHAWLNHWQHL